MGIFFYFFNISESYLPWVAAAILFLSVFVGGFWAAFNSGGFGIHHGVTVGLCFFIISLLLVLLFFPGKIALISAIKKLILTTVGGALGGIVGVGFGSN